MPRTEVAACSRPQTSWGLRPDQDSPAEAPSKATTCLRKTGRRSRFLPCHCPGPLDPKGWEQNLPAWWVPQEHHHPFPRFLPAAATQAPGTHSPTLPTAAFGPHLPPRPPLRIKGLLRANSESLLSAPAWHKTAAGRGGGRPWPCLSPVWLCGLCLPPPSLGAWELGSRGAVAPRVPGLLLGWAAVCCPLSLPATWLSPCSAAPFKPPLARHWA